VLDHIVSAATTSIMLEFVPTTRCTPAVGGVHPAAYAQRASLARRAPLSGNHRSRSAQSESLIPSNPLHDRPAPDRLAVILPTCRRSKQLGENKIAFQARKMAQKAPGWRVLTWKPSTSPTTATVPPFSSNGAPTPSILPRMHPPLQVGVFEILSADPANSPPLSNHGSRLPVQRAIKPASCAYQRIKEGFKLST